MLKEFDMELIKRQIKEYLKWSKKIRSQIISQYCELTKVKRATAVKRFGRYRRRYLFGGSGDKEGFRCRKGRKRKYGPIHKDIIKKCWELSGCVCAEKLHPMLPVYIDQLRRNGRLSFYEASFVKQVEGIPLGSLKRIMGEFPRVLSRRYRGDSFIYQKVPIVADFGRYAKERPGYVEVDFIEHNGGSSAGVFAITAVYTDLYSQWIARAGGLGKNISSVSEIDRIAHTRIPFQVIQYHPDNDKTILKVLFERVRGKKYVSLSRGRPYKKNDNAHVEQKGGDKVRKLVGYQRFDREEEVRILNEIYERADLLDNFFIACFKLKERIKDEKGRTLRKVYEEAKTPYERLMESEYLEEKEKERLRRIYEGLNMVKLREEIDKLIEELINGRSKERETKVNFRDKKYDLTRPAFQGQ